MEKPVAAHAIKMNTPKTWRELKRRLEAQRAAPIEEIGAYPGPITGCDAQFNHLLELRSGINRELQRLEAARGDGAALRQFVKTCDFLFPPDGDKKT